MSTLVPKFRQPKTGASNRPFNEKLQETFSGKDFGAVEDATANDSTALTNASNACASTTNTVLLEGVTRAPDLDIATVIDTTFVGKVDHLAEAYRKYSVPMQAPSDSLQSVDIVPTKHLVNFGKAYKPKVVILGDSLTTYFANSIARGDMLTDNLRKVLNNQCPRGVDFYNYGIGGTAYQSLFTNLYSAGIPWYQGYSTSNWIDVAKALEPDLVILSFGMNDSSGIKTVAVKNAIDYIQTWPKVPSIVLCTNLVPSPASTAFPEGEAGQEGRDEVAGFVRTYANYRDVGLLDFHRKDCMVRDAFDPTSSCITKGTLINAVGNSVTGIRECYDWKVQIAYDAAALTTGSGYITAKTGPGANDFIQIIKTDATHMQAVSYAGSTDSVAIDIGTGLWDYTWPTTGINYLAVEKIGGYISIYEELTTNAYGSFAPPIAFGKCISLGGLYTPKIQCYPSGVLTNTTFNYGEARVSTPSVTDTILWGGNTPSDIGFYGGSGYNHPGGFAATHIYRPLIQSVQWYQKQNIIGQAAVASGISSLVVNFVPAQKAYFYGVLLSEVGANIGSTYRISAYTDTSFTVSFSPATAGPGNLVYQIIEPVA